MGVSIIELFVLLFVLATGVAVVGLIVWALAHGRFGIATVIGGTAIIVLLLLGIGLYLFLAMEPHSVKFEAHGPAWTGSPLNDMTSGAPQIRTFPDSILLMSGRLLLFGGVIAALAIVAIRQLATRGAACAPHAARWPALLLLVPLLGVFFLFGSVRVQRSSEMRVAQEVQRQAERVQQDIARRHETIVNRTAQMQADAQHRIAKMDIHELMNKSDEPRIALSSQPVAPPPSAEPPLAEAPPAPAASTSEPDKSEKPSAELAEAASSESGKAESKSNDESAEKPAESEAKSDDKKTEAAAADEPAKKTEARQSTAKSKTTKKSERKKSGTVSPKSLAAPLAEHVTENKSVSRPAWTDEQPKRVGTSWRQVIVTDEYASREECNRAADVFLLLATYNHLMQINGTAEVTDHSLPELTLHYDSVLANGQVIISNGTVYDHRLKYLSRIGVGIDMVRREIAKDEYVETVDRGFVEPMKKLYTLVEFSSTVDDELRQKANAYRREERFAVVGAGMGSIIGLLSMVWGLLKIDTWTKGYYTKRLFLGVPAAIIVVLLLLNGKTVVDMIK
jgi:outer membrane biosynthesis protein TonB